MSSLQAMDLKYDDQQYQAVSRAGFFKLDEGFVDETRSLDDGDSAMELEPRMGNPSRIPHDPLITLHEAVMSLSESQRSGKSQSIIC